MEPERLQKILARAGYGSRRACEKLISDGRVTLEGKIAHLGDKADPDTQRIYVDGVLLAKPQAFTYILLHKPRGYITTTSDPQGRRTVLDLVNLSTSKSSHNPSVRLYPVGRLDADSEGLVLLTNDGSLTQKLTHPSYGHPRVYRVLIAEEPSRQTLERWQQGITLDGRLTRFSSVMLDGQSRGKTWLRVTIHEGRKHLVRRMVATLGHPALRLIRIQMGPLLLNDLAVGQWRTLSRGEVRALQAVQVVNKTKKQRGAKPQPGGKRSRSRESRGGI
ncbi:MAG: pseudouridine synthase [Anaerolineae bacterium]|nr:pseudouridine synthase [Anaerolineae bacterium]